MTLTPRNVDTIVLTEQTDFAALVREILRGGGGVGSRSGNDRQRILDAFRAGGHLADDIKPDEAGGDATQPSKDWPS
jgi:hypothetical protein